MTKALNLMRNLVRDNKSGVWNARAFVWVDGKRSAKRKCLCTRGLAEARRLVGWAAADARASRDAAGGAA